jgi:hypothetical protein
MKQSVLVSSVALLVTVGLFGAQPESGPFEIVIANGRVIDPQSGLDAVRHVGISRGTIRAVSTNPLTAAAVFDARGLVVAPGFIDLHQHGQTPDAYRLKAADGVTTALELEVGTGDIDAFYGERAGKSLINYGATIGHIPVRMAALGDPGDFLPSGPAASREATEAELQQIIAGIRRGLERGAVGVGFGIAYTPQAARTEILDVFSSICAGAIRSEGPKKCSPSPSPRGRRCISCTCNRREDVKPPPCCACSAWLANAMSM